MRKSTILIISNRNFDLGMISSKKGGIVEDNTKQLLELIKFYFGIVKFTLARHLQRDLLATGVSKNSSTEGYRLSEIGRRSRNQLKKDY